MKWKYVKPITNSQYIYESERELNYQFPKDFIECIKENNAGMPEFPTFDTKNSKERVFHHLLSFNKTDRINIFNMNSNNENIPDNYIAFAIDVFGNFICFNKLTNSIALVEHETQRIEQIADNFIDFLNELY